MSTIPLNTQFIGLASTVDTTERRSALINAESQAYTMQDIVDTAGLPYKSYTVKLSQSGTDNPTVNTLFYNNTGLTFNWVRFITGIYYAQPVGIDYSKVAIFATNGTDGNSPYATLMANSGGGPTGNAIWIYTYKSTDSQPSDDELKNASLEIRVYP